MPSGENLDKVRHLAHSSPNVGKHGKRKSTIAREQAREVAIKYLTEHFIKDADPIIQKWVEKAKKGDNDAIKDLLNRTIGKPQESLEVTVKKKLIQDDD